MRFDYDSQPDSAPVLGLIVLQADETIEGDMRRLLPDAAPLVSRVPSGQDVTTDTLAAMQADLPAAAGLMPRGLSFDVVGYGCTSGTSVIGAEAIADLVRQGTVARAVTEPVSALIAACATLGVTRIGFLSPYVAEVSTTLRDTLSAAGIASPVLGSFEEAEESKVVRIAPQSIIAAATALAAEGGIDALFLSCTNLRTLDVIAPLEAATGLPVLSSNLVLGWHMARLAGIGFAGPGRLA